MGILNADHPDVIRFIKAKIEEGKLRIQFHRCNYKFMHAVLNDEDWQLEPAYWEVESIKADICSI